MNWLHIGWVLVVAGAALIACWTGILLRRQRRRAGGLSRPNPAPQAVARRLAAHRIAGWVFATSSVVGFGLGVLAVRRAGRPVLTSSHALVGAVLLMMAAIASLSGTALGAREERRLVRLHRLFAWLAFLLLVAQVVLGTARLLR